MTALAAPDRRLSDRRVSPAVGQFAIQECARLRDALEQIEQWTRAYPISVFTEPDWDKVKALLGPDLLTCVSASNMRHVLTGVENIARDALAHATQPRPDQSEGNPAGPLGEI